MTQSDKHKNIDLWLYAIGSLVLGVLCIVFWQLCYLFGLFAFLFGLNFFLMKGREKPKAMKIVAAIGLLIGLGFILFTIYAILAPAIQGPGRRF